MKSIIKDKKGFLPLAGLSIGALVVIGIFIILLVLSVLFFTSLNKVAVIGGGMIALALIYGLRGDFNTQKAWFLGIIIILGLLFVFSGDYLQNFTGGSNAVYLPEYSSTWCAVCNIGEQSDVETVDVNPGFWGKDSFQEIIVPTEDYIPNGFFVDINPSGYDGEIAMYLCNKNIDVNLVREQLDKELDNPFSGGKTIQGCTFYDSDSFKISGLSRKIQQVRMNKDQRLHIGTEVDYTWKWSYEPFCLFTLKRGQLSSYSDCSRTNLIKNVKDIPIGTPNLIRGQDFSIENVVIGYTEVVNPVDIVDNKYLRESLGEFQSCPIKTGNDGKRYVDLVGCNRDSSIKCIPSLPPVGFICEKGTKLTQIKYNSECSGSGVIGTRIVDDQSCELICSNGKLSTRNCQDVVGLNKGEKVECRLNSDCPVDYKCENNLCVKLIPLAECKWFQELKVKNEVIRSWYNYIGIGEPKVVSQQICATAGWVYGAMAGVVIIVLGTVAIRTRKPKRRIRRKRR